jgi:hypothetical protein
MAAPGILEVSKRLLRDFGNRSLSASVPAEQVAPIERGDREDIAMVLNAAIQEYYDLCPTELASRPRGAFLNAPTGVTFTATKGSSAISHFVTWAEWMVGCTIRMDDGSDNELLSAIELARPYAGATGSGKAGTVYGDSALLDETTQAILDPVYCDGDTNGWPLPMAQSLAEFLRMCGWPMLYGGYAYPLWLCRTRPMGDPLHYIVDGIHDTSLGYARRRIRFSPMPSRELSIAYTCRLNPPRISPDDITEGNTKPLPIADGAVERLFLPLCRQQLTGMGHFKNEEVKAEIARAYTKAVEALMDKKAARGAVYAKYPVGPNRW